MNKLWTALLQKAIAALMGVNWLSVVMQVGKVAQSDLPGEQKRQIVFDTLRSFGVDCATWLLYAAIEIAYGKLKESK